MDAPLASYRLSPDELTQQIAILFFSTSPSSPFLTHLSPSPAPPPDNTLPLDSPIPNRGAFYLNGLRLFDPTLVGYREMSRVWHDVVNGQDEVSVDGLGWWPGKWKMGMSSFGPKESDGATKVVNDGGGEDDSDSATLAEHASDADDAAADGDATKATPYIVHTESPLPKHYVDLRFGGLGFVLDLGWRRTDEGLRWEVEDTMRAAALNRRAGPAAPAKKDVLDSTEPQRAQHSGWLRSPFVNSW